MADVKFVSYTNQSDFEQATLVDGALYFIADTHKIYKGKAGSNNTVEAVDFSEPFELVTSSTLPSLASARIGCLYICTDTYEIVLKPTSSAQSYTTIVPALSTALSKLTTVYTYKGSKATYSALPASADNAVGDVWNVEAAYNNYPAGTNFAWNGSAWDALGGNFDGYLTTSSSLNSLSDVDTSGAANGRVLMYDTSGATPVWKPAAVPSGVTQLSALNDVSVSSMTSGQVLTYDSTLNSNEGGWKNADIPVLTWTEVTGS